MIDLFLVGVGMGAPDHLTRQAEAVLRAADVILIPTKGAEKAELADVRRKLCDHLEISVERRAEFELPTRNANGDYLEGVQNWHDAVAQAWAAALADRLPDGGRAALMIWGDPSLYDSSLRIAERLPALGQATRTHVTPGLTSLQLLTAAFAMPLNRLGAPVHITTGRRLREGGWPEGCDDVAVMLDGGAAFSSLAPDGIDIYWGAYLGMPQQILRDGPLAQASPDIVEAREAARARHGWIMDTYLLRRRECLT